jgi:hypothetical protein
MPGYKTLKMLEKGEPMWILGGRVQEIGGELLKFHNEELQMLLLILLGLLNREMFNGRFV